MKAGSDRKYTAEFRDAAVKQVEQGKRSMAAVARSLEMSSKTLANWVYLTRKGQALVKRRRARGRCRKWRLNLAACDRRTPGCDWRRRS